MAYAEYLLSYFEFRHMVLVWPASNKKLWVLSQMSFLVNNIYINLSSSLHSLLKDVQPTDRLILADIGWEFPGSSSVVTNLWLIGVGSWAQDRFLPLLEEEQICASIFSPSCKPSSAETVCFLYLTLPAHSRCSLSDCWKMNNFISYLSWF